MPNMGLAYGLDSANTCFKRKNRWLFKIGGISASGVNSLPPSKSARPSVSFKEMDIQHVTETVYYPSKPEWKPIQLTLYDTQNSNNPVFSWLRQLYDPAALNNNWSYSSVEPNVAEQVYLPQNLSIDDSGFTSNAQQTNSFFKIPALLEMYNGCGDLIEAWGFDNAWPQNIEWGDLDMASSEILTVDITLRYDRAYLLSNS